MNAGNLDELIVLEAKTKGQTGSGAKQETWSGFAEVWAEWLPGPGGGRTYEQDQRVVERMARAKIRYRDDVSEKVQVRRKGEAWEILRADELGRDEGLMLHLRARPV